MLRNNKSARRPHIGDKHKTRRLEGRSLTFWTDWLMTSSRWRLKLDNKRRSILLILSIGLIVGGIWFSSTNAFKFVKGYYLFKTTSAEKVAVESDTETITEDTSLTEDEPPQEDVDKPLYSFQPEIGEDIGDLYIPKIDSTLPIYHGTDEDELEKGVGHFAGSVLPGEDDNTVLAGHRDTVFRRLGEVGVGDLLVVTTSAGEFTYKVRKVRIVDSDNRTVIVPKPKATLTVSTCYPFDFIGDAPERYVLIADLME